MGKRPCTATRILELLSQAPHLEIHSPSIRFSSIRSFVEFLSHELFFSSFFIQ
jgi:hypothetical protein